MFEKSKIKSIINTKFTMTTDLRKAGSILEQLYVKGESEAAELMLQHLFDSILQRWSDADAALPSNGALVDYAARLVGESAQDVAWDGEATGASEARILVRATALTLMLGEKFEQSEDLAALFAVIVDVGIRVRYLNSAQPEEKTASVNLAIATAAWEAYQAVRHAEENAYYHDMIYAAENEAIDAIDGDSGVYGLNWRNRLGELLFDIVTEDEDGDEEPAPVPIKLFTADDLLGDDEQPAQPAVSVHRVAAPKEFDIPLRPAAESNQATAQPSSLKIGKGFAPVPAHVSDEEDFFEEAGDLTDPDTLAEAADIAEEALSDEVRRSIDALFDEDDCGTADSAGAAQEKPGYDPRAVFQAIFGAAPSQTDDATED